MERGRELISCTHFGPAIVGWGGRRFTGPPGEGLGAGPPSGQLSSGQGPMGARAHPTPGTSSPCREGANISKSLTTLGKVISHGRDGKAGPGGAARGMGWGWGLGVAPCPACPCCGAGPTEKPQSVGMESPAGGGAGTLSFPGACETGDVSSLTGPEGGPGLWVL